MSETTAEQTLTPAEQRRAAEAAGFPEWLVVALGHSDWVEQQAAAWQPYLGPGFHARPEFVAVNVDDVESFPAAIRDLASRYRELGLLHVEWSGQVSDVFKSPARVVLRDR